MKTTSTQKRAAILRCLIEGNSILATSAFAAKLTPASHDAKDVPAAEAQDAVGEGGRSLLKN